MNTPVALIIFNRPDRTRRVFERIREAQPPVLFVIADGPRNVAERVETDTTRAVTDQVDWSCDVHRIYSDRNLGVGWRYPTGMDEVFRHVDRIIALEDDVLPDLTYFQFCDELLEHYAQDDRIAIIGGSNYQLEPIDGPSYRFTHSLWHQGVAFWRRTWEQYEPYARSFVESEEPRQVIEQRYSGSELNNYLAAVQRMHLDPLNEAYDYKLSYAWTSRGQWAIQPSHNLLTNIGFGADGSHPSDANHKNANLPARPMRFPLIHPDAVPDRVTPTGGTYANSR